MGFEEELPEWNSCVFFPVAQEIMANVSFFHFLCFSNNSISCYVGKLFCCFFKKKVSEYIYYNANSIWPMEMIFIVLSHSGSWNFCMSSWTRMRWYICFTLCPQCFSRCVSIVVVVKIFPYFYYCRNNFVAVMAPTPFIDNSLWKLSMMHFGRTTCFAQCGAISFVLFCFFP